MSACRGQRKRENDVSEAWEEHADGEQDRLQLPHRRRYQRHRDLRDRRASQRARHAPIPTVLTDNTVADLAPIYAPDGERILFQRGTPFGPQRFTMAPARNPDGTLPTPTQVTFGAPGGPANMSANWGELRLRGHGGH
jgi:hypothetical protein